MEKPQRLEILSTIRTIVSPGDAFRLRPLLKKLRRLGLRGLTYQRLYHCIWQQVQRGKIEAEDLVDDWGYDDRVYRLVA